MKSHPANESLDEFWEKIAYLSLAFEDIVLIITCLQRADLTVSDAYGLYLEIKLKTQQKYDQFRTNSSPNSHLARNFLGHFTDNLLLRLKPIFSSPHALGCIYLDPRFQCALTLEQKNIAIEFLVNLHGHMEIASREENASQSTTEALHTVVLEDDIVDTFLNPTIHSDESISVQSMHFDIKSCLRNFNYPKEKRLKVKETNIHKFWEQQKFYYPELHKLSEITTVISPTDVPNERDFSDLNFILNSKRTNLIEENLEKILIVKLNKDLFDEN